MGALNISVTYFQVDQRTPKNIRIIDRPITLFIGAFLDNVMALVVGMIIFQVLCQQSWVVKFVHIFFSLFKLPHDQGFLLVHVDDVWCAINEQSLNTVAKPILDLVFASPCKLFRGQEVHLNL